MTNDVLGRTSAGALNLERLLRPRSIAIVGASANPGSTGRRVLANLERFSFSGEIHLVSRQGGEIAGHTSVTDIAALPMGVDLAVLAVPGTGVRDAVAQCVARGIGAAVVYASGFAEMGPEGRREQEEIARIAREGGLALVGPNCIGLTSFVDGTPLSFGIQQPAVINDPAVAILGQSGGMVGNIRLSCTARALPVSYTISTGNEAVLTINDFVAHIIDDTVTRVIAIFAEQLRDPQRFLALARDAFAAGKRIVLIHPGRSIRAQEAAASHTGSLATDHAVMQTLVTSAGVILVNGLDELTDVVELLLRTPDLPQQGPAILTESGAFKGLAADMCADLGLGLPDLSVKTGERLACILPAFAHISNPLDVTAQGLQQLDIYGHAVSALLADPAVGSVILVLMPGSPEFGLKVVEEILPSIAGAAKPVIYTLLGDNSPIAPEIAGRLREAGIAFFRSPERALRAVARLWSAARTRPLAPRDDGIVIDLPATTGVLPEHRGKALLREAGLPIPAGRLAVSAADAALAASEIDGPVALKAQSAVLTHKSDLGGVSLNLSDEASVLAAFATQTAAIAKHRPDVVLDGVLVEAMAPRGHELVVSVRRDTDWGPVMMVGLGGVWIEALHDVAMLSPDSDRQDVLRALNGLKGGSILRGWRGEPAADLEAVVDTVVQLGRIIRGNPRIEEIEINPLSVRDAGQGATVLDALVTLS
ncbi:acyl-CoA synthetase [Sphingomonas sp. BHC-A]|nr:acyl-CoA synthetase [Sphingomonas sp. BHC-A]